MKRSSIVIVVILMIVSFQIGWGQPYPFSGKTSLAVETGWQNFEGRLGEGRFFKVTLSKNFFKNPSPIDLIDFGIGIQYYDKKVSEPEYYPMAEQGTIVVDKDVLNDYYPFATARLNLPAANFLRFSVGTQLGFHFIERFYEQHSAYDGQVFTYRNNYNATSFGRDLFLQVILGVPSFPVGLQAELGYNYLTDVKGSRQQSTAVALGIYLQH